MKIVDYLDAKLVYFLHTPSKDETLKELVHLCMHTKRLPDGERFHQAICEREKIVSTGIGMGVAIPHAKLPSYDDFFIAIGIMQKGVDWNALDGAPVRLVFLIGGPDDKQAEYLKILSSLTVILRDEDLRKQLVLATSGQEVIRLFKNL